MTSTHTHIELVLRGICLRLPVHASEAKLRGCVQLTVAPLCCVVGPVPLREMPSTLSVCVLLLVALIACTAGVEARRSHRAPSTYGLHTALWARTAHRTQQGH